jgi:hypothetical protein
MGRVKAIETNRIVLDRGEIATGPHVLHIDCSAKGVAPRPVRPIFEGHRITVQFVRTCQPGIQRGVYCLCGGPLSGRGKEERPLWRGAKSRAGRRLDEHDARKLHECLLLVDRPLAAAMAGASSAQRLQWPQQAQRSAEARAVCRAPKIAGRHSWRHCEPTTAVGLGIAAESECQRARHEPFTTTDIVDRKTAIIGLGHAALPGPATDGIALLQSRLVTAGSR